jgi:hypothetical protein
VRGRARYSGVRRFGLADDGAHGVTRPTKRNQAGLVTGLICLETGFVSNYAVRFLRRKRMVLAPNGTSSKAPAIIVVGSGTAVTSNRAIIS